MKKFFSVLLLVCAVIDIRAQKKEPSTTNDKDKDDTILSDRIYAERLGATNNGKGDNLAWVARANATGRAISFNRPGVYIFGGNVTFTVPVHLADGAILKVPNGDTIQLNNTTYLGRRKHFDTTGVVLFGGAAVSAVNPKWWGALGDDAADDTKPMQLAIDCAIASTGAANKLLIPGGTYKITKGLLVARFNGSAFGFFQLTIEGENGVYTVGQGNGATAVIHAVHTDNFALGIQFGKGIYVRNIFIYGQNVLNRSPKQVFDADYKTGWVVKGCRDRINSPYAGIVTDPFHFYTPAAERYPRFGDYYVNKGTTGSTNINFEHVAVNGFVTDICISPNGGSQNGENFLLSDIALENAKVGIAVCQSQSRTIYAKNIKCWNSIRTIFSTNEYGQGNGVLPQVDGMNIAGGNYELFQVGGNFSYGFFRNVYAEALFRIGDGQTIHPVTFEQCYFDFALAAFGGYISSTLLTGNAYRFDGCTVYYYDGFMNPMNFRVNHLTFEDCYLGAPITNTVTNAFKEVIYRNTKIVGVNGIAKGGITLMAANIPATANAGNALMGTPGTEYLVRTDGNGLHYSRKVISEFPESGFIESSIIQVDTASNPRKLKFGSAAASRWRVNDIITTITPFTGEAGTVIGAAIGRIVSVTKDTVTAVGIPKGIAAMHNKSMVLSRQVVTTVRKVTLGNLVKGSNMISSVVVEEGTTITTEWGVGDYITARSGIPAGAYITAVDNAAGTIRISANATASVTDAFVFSAELTGFGRNNAEPASPTHGYIAGDLITNNGVSSTTVAGWVCTKTGIVGSPHAPVFARMGGPVPPAGQH